MTTESSQNTKTLPENTNNARQKSKPDSRWLIILVVIVSVLTTSIYLNTNHTKTDSTKIAETIDIDNGDLKINWGRYQTIDVKLSDTYTITESGTYHLTGTLEDGAIIIDASISEVRLVLDNVTINNSTGPAIICHNAEDLVIELVGDNTIADNNVYSSSYDEDVTGTIYSKADLTFQGTGTLNLAGNYQDAIIGKDDVKFNSGTYNITAADDAIRGKDSVYIVGGNFIINSNADNIKVTNETDTGKGFILIENGNFNLTSATAKGIKATKDILIYGGNFILDTYDDTIHSNNYIGITGGTINITAGDDGIHADRELIIDDGNIHIAKAYEGLEAQVVTINGGDISLTTNDDGINAGGGADNSSQNRPGANPFNADENCILSINGGSLYVNSAGDGIDSNGWLYFNGGTVTVDGPTNNGNGALDAGVGIVMNGGEVLAIGSSGMAETLGDTSNINNVSIYLTTIQPADTTITIKDSSDNTILTHTSAKQFSHLAIGTNKFTFGSTYKLYLNDELSTEFTISNITTIVGKTQNNFRR